MYWCYLCCSYICWCWLRRVFSENSTGRGPVRCFISLLRKSRGVDTTLVLVSVISSFFSSREYTRRMIQNRQAKKDRFWTAPQKLDTLPTLGGAVFYGKIFRWIPTCRRLILFGREQQRKNRKPFFHFRFIGTQMGDKIQITRWERHQTQKAYDKIFGRIQTWGNPPGDGAGNVPKSYRRPTESSRLLHLAAMVAPLLFEWY